MKTLAVLVILFFAFGVMHAARNAQAKDYVRYHSNPNFDKFSLPYSAGRYANVCE